MKYAAYLVVVMLTGLAPARAAAQPAGTVIRGIQIVPDGPITQVLIEADGPLPLPLSEPLTDPPRIYFDLAGVTYKIKGTTVAPGGIVRRVRIGLRPEKATRVVLDLTRRESYRINADDHKSGRLRVLIGPESAIDSALATKPAVPAKTAAASPNPPSPAVPPARIAEPPARPAPASNPTPAVTESPGIAAPAKPPAVAPPASGRSPVLSPEPPRPALPAGEVVVYRKQIYGELARMEALRALVARIDAGENVAADTLVPAAQEFTEIRTILEAVQPSVALSVAHDLLMTSCTFGAMASRLGIDAARDNSPETRRRAASAAAGSLMLFDRACADLGCTRTR
jgi:hypothetical protein